MLPGYAAALFHAGGGGTRLPGVAGPEVLHTGESVSYCPGAEDLTGDEDGERPAHR